VQQAMQVLYVQIEAEQRGLDLHVGAIRQSVRRCSTRVRLPAF
jgi:hypothetical protein